MILVTSPSKPFEFTMKGQLRRHVILRDYHDAIEALYKEVENRAQSEFVPPPLWDNAPPRRQRRRRPLLQQRPQVSFRAFTHLARV